MASFFSTVENIQKELDLSVHRQRKALKVLEEMGLVDVQYKDSPPKRYIKLNEDKMFEVFFELKSYCDDE